MLIAETGPVTDRLRVREIDDDEGQRLVRIIRRGIGSVVTWRRAQMVLLSAQGMDVPAIAKVAFTSEDRVRDVIRNFSADGFGSLYPKHKGGRPPKFTRKDDAVGGVEFNGHSHGITMAWSWRIFKLPNAAFDISHG